MIRTHLLRCLALAGTCAILGAGSVVVSAQGTSLVACVNPVTGAVRVIAATDQCRSPESAVTLVSTLPDPPVPSPVLTAGVVSVNPTVATTKPLPVPGVGRIDLACNGGIATASLAVSTISVTSFVYSSGLLSGYQAPSEVDLSQLLGADRPAWITNEFGAWRLDLFLQDFFPVPFDPIPCAASAIVTVVQRN